MLDVKILNSDMLEQLGLTGKEPYEVQLKAFYEQLASEDEYLEWYKEQDLPTYDKPSVAVDLIALSYSESSGVSLLVIKRKAHPFRNKYAFCGGFLEKSESLIEACLREVSEEMSLTPDKSRLVQLHPITTPNRDPRTWVISVPFIVYLTAEELELAKAGDDALEVCVLELGRNLNNIEKYKDDFAFDHYQILKDAIEGLKREINYNPTVLAMLPPFTASEGAKLLEVWLGMNIFSNHFYNKYKRYLKPVGRRKNVGYRPPLEYVYQNPRDEVNYTPLSI